MRQTEKLRDRITRLDAHHAKLAAAAGMALRRPSSGLPSSLPDNLSATFALNERELMRVATRRFAKAFNDGRPVYFVTVCHPAWVCDRDQLTPELVETVRKWVSRRARVLTKHGQHRMVGAVDVAWNVGRRDWVGKFWCVHVHFLIGVDVGTADEVHTWIHEAFHCPPDQAGRIGKPVFAALIKDNEHLENTIRYTSGALALHDDDASQHRHRRRRRTLAGGFNSKEVLPPGRSAEFTRLMAAMGPSKLWVLSGLRRRGERIERENSKVVLARRDVDCCPENREDAAKKMAVAEMRIRIDAIASDYLATKSTDPAVTTAAP